MTQPNRIVFARVSLPFIPPEELMPNYSGEKRATWGFKTSMKRRGVEYGRRILVGLRNYPGRHRLLSPQAKLEIIYEVWQSSTHPYDADNLLAGFKYFTDGLQESTVIWNDKCIMDMRVRTYNGMTKRGMEVSRITISEADEEEWSPWVVDLMPEDGGEIPD